MDIWKHSWKEDERTITTQRKTRTGHSGSNSGDYLIQKHGNSNSNSNNNKPMNNNNGTTMIPVKILAIIIITTIFTKHETLNTKP